MHTLVLSLLMGLSTTYEISYIVYQHTYADNNTPHSAPQAVYVFLAILELFYNLM